MTPSQTPERCEITSDYADRYEITDMDGDILATFYSVSEANLKRIVACLNACAGIPTETLDRILVQQGSIRNLFD